MLPPKARGWGLVFLLISMLLSLAMLPLTIIQMQALFGFGERPFRADYLVFIWSAVPVVVAARRSVRVPPAVGVARRDPAPMRRADSARLDGRAVRGGAGRASCGATVARRHGSPPAASSGSATDGDAAQAAAVGSGRQSVRPPRGRLDDGPEQHRGDEEQHDADEERRAGPAASFDRGRHDVEDDAADRDGEQRRPIPSRRCSCPCTGPPRRAG